MADELIAIPERFRGLGVAHLSEYFGPWAILVESFEAAVDRVNRLDLRVHVEQGLAAAGGSSAGGVGAIYQMAPGGVAVIDIRGELMKMRSSFSDGTSTVFARRQIRAAAADDDVSSILLRIDSPGGTVSGTSDLADDVAAANRIKPVDAYIEDLGASAAYWVASQARKVFAGRAALVGSIGTYGVLQDMSMRAAQAGVKVIVVKAGQFKGAGVPGAEITAEQVAYWQDLIESLNDHFIRAVASGRGFTLERTRELADGRVHVGQAALQLGLVDGIQSFDQTLSQLQSRKPRSAKTMAAETTVAGNAAETAAPAPAASQHPKPATYHELANGCAGADATFICSQLSANATLAQAQSAWMAEQNKRLEAAKAEAAQAKAAATRPGVDPLGAGDGGPAGGGDADPTAAWNKAVDEAMAGGKLQRAQAIARVAAARPELHRAYLESFNAEHRRKHPPRR